MRPGRLVGAGRAGDTTGASRKRPPRRPLSGPRRDFSLTVSRLGMAGVCAAAKPPSTNALLMNQPNRVRAFSVERRPSFQIALIFQKIVNDLNGLRGASLRRSGLRAADETLRRPPGVVALEAVRRSLMVCRSIRRNVRAPE